jgi:hypothetical protein
MRLMDEKDIMRALAEVHANRGKRPGGKQDEDDIDDDDLVTYGEKKAASTSRLQADMEPEQYARPAGQRYVDWDRGGCTTEELKLALDVSRRKGVITGGVGDSLDGKPPSA